MSTTSAIGAAIGALTTLATNAAAAGAFGEDAAVFEGPWTVDSQQTPHARIWIGYDPNNPQEPAAEGTQEFAALNQARSRNETFTISCAVEFDTGDADNANATARTGAFTLLAAFELLLRGTAATSGPGDTTLMNTVLWSQLTGPIAFDYLALGNGITGYIGFRVGCQFRLTTS